MNSFFSPLAYSHQCTEFRYLATSWRSWPNKLFYLKWLLCLSSPWTDLGQILRTLGSLCFLEPLAWSLTLTMVMSRIVFLWGFIKPHLEREILPNWWRILFSPNAWFMREKSSIITHYLAAPGVGENLHPIYIITSSCPSTLPTIPASRPGFRGHRKKSLWEDYTGQGLTVYLHSMWNAEKDSVLI